MPTKKKGHSKKKRHPGVGVPVQGKHEKSKTNVMGRKKVKDPTPRCPFCDEPTKGLTMVEPKGKVRRNGRYCEPCNIAVFGKQRIVRFPHWY